MNEFVVALYSVDSFKYLCYHRMRLL